MKNAFLFFFLVRCKLMRRLSENPTVSTVVLAPPMTPRQYHSGFLSKNGNFYIFGGVMGMDGATAVPVPDIFVMINICTLYPILLAFILYYLSFIIYYLLLFYWFFCIISSLIFSFIILQTDTGVTQELPCPTPQCPRASVTNPVLFMNPSETILYVFSGMQSDSLTFDNQLLYNYDIASMLPPFSSPPLLLFVIR